MRESYTRDMSKDTEFHISGPTSDEDNREITWSAAVATGQVEAYEVEITVRYPKGNTAWSEAKIRACKEEAKGVLANLVDEIVTR